VAPSRTGASELQRAAPRQADPPRRSEERPTPVRQLFESSDRPDSDSLQRHWLRVKSMDSASTPSASQVVESGADPRRLQSLLIRGGGAPDVHVSLVTGGGQESTPTIAEAEGSALEQMSALPPLRWRIEEEQPPSWRARSVQPPSRARRAARRSSLGCAPKCKLSSLVHPSWIFRLVLLINLASIFS
jgi:hypothetical protein